MRQSDIKLTLMNWAHLLPLLAFIVIPAIAAIVNYLIVRRHGKSTVKKFSTYTILNSAVLFALAYNIIFFLQEVFLVLGKNRIGLTAILYHNNHNWIGDHPKAALMQGSGAAAIFIAGILFYLLQFLIDRRSWARMLMVWLAFNGMLQSLPQFATAKLAPETDTGQALAYLSLGDTTEWTISFGSYVLIIVALIWFARTLLQFSPDNSSALNRFHFLKNAVMLAALLSIGLIIPFRIPPYDRIMSVVFLVLLCVPMMMAFGWRKSSIHGAGNIINEKLLIIPLILLVLLLLFFQLYLAPGVKFIP
jgi:hypothetical protein